MKNANGFLADDGTFFDTQEECVLYEETEMRDRCIKKRIRLLRHGIYSGGYPKDLPREARDCLDYADPSEPKYRELDLFLYNLLALPAKNENGYSELEEKVDLWHHSIAYISGR